MGKHSRHRGHVGVDVPSVALAALVVVGALVLLYPTVSDLWNSLHQSRVIVSYAEKGEELSAGERAALLDEARAYNEGLVGDEDRLRVTDAERDAYEGLLDVDSTGVIGTVEIDKIGCSLPIYRGTDPAVLQVGAGHLEGSSLPVGGPSTHAVITGHRGLPSARLFTDLDELEAGDTFRVTVLGETLTYEVDQVKVVEPTDTSDLGIEEGRDLFTLLTCTPYGVNSQRLLVRGHRVAGFADASAPEEGPGPAEVARVAVAAGAGAVSVALVGRALVRARTARRVPRGAHFRRRRS